MIFLVSWKILSASQLVILLSSLAMRLCCLIHSVCIDIRPIGWKDNNNNNSNNNNNNNNDDDDDDDDFSPNIQV